MKSNRISVFSETAAKGLMLALMTGLAAGIVLPAPSALAHSPGSQDRLPPPPPPPQATDGFDRIENLGGFVGAYRRSGSPRVLVFADVTGRGGAGYRGER